MPDSKITALTALTAADPAVDMFPIVDVSDTTMAASGTTKRISINNLLACSPSATLASATITGALGAAGLNVTGATIPANGVYLGSANNLSFSAASTLGMTLNANGLGVGGSPNTGLLTVGATTNASATANALTILSQRATIVVTANGATDAAGTTINYAWASGGQGPLIFRNAAIANVMTLDASGNLLVGTTSSPLASRVSVGVTNGQPDAFVIRNSAATVGLYWRLAYVNSTNTFHILNQGGVGVYLTDGATSWTGTSDERLKDIIEPISNAVEKVGSLRSVIGKFKTDDASKRRSFLIAQDVQKVLPEAVDVSNPDKLGVAYSEVIPLLVAAIKELTARVQTLETR